LGALTLFIFTNNAAQIPRILNIFIVRLLSRCYLLQLLISCTIESIAAPCLGHSNQFQKNTSTNSC